MAVYILPVALFVITLILMLALRAEDKKSRSLQNVKDKISSFRTESQQTMARINETARDCSERVEAKKRDVVELIDSLDASISNLARHREELGQLEAVCRGYELALDKLRIQTEHAEDRIKTVQDEVVKAGHVQAVIDGFHADVAALQDDFSRLTAAAADLVTKTEEDLASTAERHKAKADEMIRLFGEELDHRMAGLEDYAAGLREDFDGRKDAVAAAVAEAAATLEQHRIQIDEATDAAIARLGERQESFRTYAATTEDDLRRLRASIEEYKTSIDEGFATSLSTLDEKSSKLEAEAEAAIVRLGGERDVLVSSIKEEEGVLEGQRASIAQSVSQWTEALSSHRDGILSMLDEKRTALSDDMSRMDEAAASLKQELEEFKAGLVSEIGNERIRLGADKEALSREVDERKASLKSLEEGIMSSIEEQKNALAEEGRQASADAMAAYDEMAGRFNSEAEAMRSAISDERKELDEALSNMRNAVSALKSDIEGSLTSLEERRAQVDRDGEAFSSGCQQRLSSFQEELKTLADASATSFSQLVMEGEDNITKLSSELRDRFKTDSQQVFDSLDQAKEDFRRFHDDQKAGLAEEEASYSASCRKELGDAMRSELADVSRVYDSMVQASTEQLGNFARRLTEIKEAITMLNQGLDGNLNRSSEKISQVQARLSSSEASLNETQARITQAKEELFKIQQEHRSLIDEVARSRKELEGLNARAQSAKRERENEEARLVKLQMSAKAKEAETTPPPAENKEDEYLGEEEEIPLDEE